MRIFSIVFLYLFFGLSSTAQQLDKSDFKNKFEQAFDYINQDQFEYAIPILNQLIKSDSTNANLHFLLGFSYYENGVERLKAKSHLEYANENVSKSYKHENYKERNAPLETRYYLANVYHLSYQFDKAIALFQVLAEENKKNDVFDKEMRRLISVSESAKKLFERPTKVIIENLGDSINTEFPEYSPVVSADESTLIFTSRRFDTKGGMKDQDDQKYFEDIYISEKLPNGEWSLAKPISDSINTDNHEATVGLSADGEVLYVYKGNVIGDLYKSELEGKEWSKLRKLDDNITTFATRETHAVISADKQFVFFASDREGGFGGLDLWVCKKLPNGKWALPQNLGPSVNTKEDEDAPFIHPDGKQLIFSSKGHGGMGGYDIFSSDFEIENNNWSAPTNLGYPINTTDDDIFFTTTIDGGKGYFSSRRKGGSGDQDIYMATFEEPTDKYLTLYTGFVKNSNKKSLPSGLQIIVTNTMNDMQYIYKPNSATGKYVIILTPGDYLIDYQLDGESFHQEEMFVGVENAYNIINKEVMLDMLLLDEERKKQEIAEKARQKGISEYEAEKQVEEEVIALETEFEKFKQRGELDELKEIIFENDQQKPKTEQEIFDQMLSRFSESTYEGIQFFVQVGAFRNTSEVNFDKLSDLGNIRVEKATDEISRFLIDIPFNNMGDANILKSTAIERGIDDAWVTIYYNGTRINSKKFYQIIEERNQATTPNNLAALTGKPQGLTYVRYFDYNIKEINVNDKEFKEFIKKIAELIDKKGKVSLEIESSASRVPTAKYKDNYVLVKNRAEEARLIVFQELEKIGVDRENIKMSSTNSVVQGPKYNQDAKQNQDIYKKFQYVKLVVK